MVKIINMVIVTLLVNNFLYKYFIGANFFEDTKGRKKLFIALNIFIILSITYMIGEVIIQFYPRVMEIDEVFYVLNLFVVYISTIAVDRVRSLEGRRAYYGASVFLINMMINLSFKDPYLRFASTLLVPIFLCLNFLFLEPLFERLKLDSKKGLVSYEITFILTIGIIAMLLNGLAGY